MNFIDLIIIAIISFGIIRGYSKGLIVELSSFFGIFISFFIAGNIDNLLSQQIVKYINLNIDIVNIISFIIIFGLSYSLIIFFAKGFTKLAKIIYLGLLNSLMGSVFGGLKLLLILLIVTKVIFSINLLSFTIVSESSLMIQLHILSEILFDSFEISREIYQDSLI
ncbi:CvpA family protein [Flavobacteriaceae bacterium]|nr:CvpA family protein [Flavobacteriaceae bacterium]MDA8934697.1 CvpA family protein [Flavobacteriaceae bacterium]MDA9084352.1 CvpA family protein [Flavobacteriaceae bacterium]MDA9211911.1 CvpA family protein [Flavobacteriaceae bacterium]MDC0879139.1 CvpA family protein [Flavobacteriaceae bacterium]|tara:strand:- start:67 stop:564 length:498 start_codon:yes stop_codon:yes gene_type:complete